MADLTIPAYKGLNNQADSTALGMEWQVQADNVLVDNAGYLVSCPGYQSALEDIKDIHATRGGRLLAVTTDNRLLEVNADHTTQTLAGSFLGAPFHWTELGYALFAISETHAWTVYPNRVVEWGVPVCEPPRLEATQGTLHKGTYLAAAIYEAPDGRLGGCPRVSSITLTESAGITFTVKLLAGYRCRIYLSQVDGAEPLFIDYTDSGQTTVRQIDDEAHGHPVPSMHCYPPPLGGQVGQYGNQLVIGVNEPELGRAVLYYSKPDYPHWFELDKDYNILRGELAVLAGIGSALLVATNQEIHAHVEGVLQKVANYGAIRDTLNYLDDGRLGFWSDKGFCVFPPFQNLTEKTYWPENRNRGSGALLRHKGSDYFVCAQTGANNTRIAGSRFSS